MTDHKALTPQPPLPAGEGEEPAGFDAVIRNQKSNQEKLDLAKYYRKNHTEAEEVVWSFLRNRQIKNLKWRRQQVIDGFIADFYCAEHKVVLEIDGSVHDTDEVKEYDEYRTSVFEEKGIKTIRVKNEECDKQHIIKIIDTILSNPR